MKFYKREWDRKRDDNFSHWGKCTLLIQADPDGHLVSQIEMYEYGDNLLYNREHPRDQYGVLSDQLIDFDDFAPYEISESDFMQIFDNLTPINRGSHVDTVNPDGDVHCDRCKGTFHAGETKTVSGLVEFLTMPGMHVHHAEEGRLYCEDCRKKVHFYFVLLIISSLICAYYWLLK